MVHNKSYSSQRQKARKSKNRSRQSANSELESVTSVIDDQLPPLEAVEPVIPSPIIEVPLEDLPPPTERVEIPSSIDPPVMSRRARSRINPLYFFYFAVAVTLFSLLTTVEFVRSTGVQSSNNLGTTNNKSLSSKVADLGNTLTNPSDSSLLLHGNDILTVVASGSDSSTSSNAEISSQQLVRAPFKTPSSNSIQLLSFHFKNSFNSFVKKITNFFQHLFSFFSPSPSTTSALLTPTPTNPHQVPNAVSVTGTNTTSEYENIVWAGKHITPKEIEGIQQLKQLIQQNKYLLKSKWSKSIHNIELLRFLRAKHHHVQHAWKGILHHDDYRRSEYGPESSFMWTAYDHSPLQLEAFWLDYNEVGCPTLVIRTQLHDGYYYNDDPKVYTA